MAICGKTAPRLPPIIAVASAVISPTCTRNPPQNMDTLARLLFSPRSSLPRCLVVRLPQLERRRWEWFIGSARPWSCQATLQAVRAATGRARRVRLNGQRNTRNRTLLNRRKRRTGQKGKAFGRVPLPLPLAQVTPLLRCLAPLVLTLGLRSL